MLFSNQRVSSGVGGLLAVAALMAAWLAVAGVMFGSYVNPEVRPSAGCQLVCRTAPVLGHG